MISNCNNVLIIIYGYSVLYTANAAYGPPQSPLHHNYNFTAAQLAGAGKPNATTGNQRNTEWAGSVFSPDGRVLFVNLYCGVTLAITGPFENGHL